jgi:ADP-ribose pyrophosphatase
VLKPEHPGDSSGQWHANVLAVEHANPWFQVLRQGVLRPDGSVGTHFTVQHARPSVGIVVVERGSFLLLRQHRFIVNRFVWAIPSGSVDPGETNLAAAIRELEEETGIRTATCRSLVSYFPSYGVSNQIFEVFVAESVVESGGRVQAAEVIAMEWFTREEVKRMVLNNEIVDGLSLVPLLMMLAA